MQLTRRQLLIAALALGATALVPLPSPAAPPPAAPCGLAALACRVAPVEWGGIFARQDEPA